MINNRSYVNPGPLEAFGGVTLAAVRRSLAEARERREKEARERPAVARRDGTAPLWDHATTKGPATP